MEIWKDFDDIYSVSNMGKIKNKKTGHILKGSSNGNGYLIIRIKKKNYYIHRLVAMLFVENPRNEKYVNHIDFNKENNNALNLEWCTQKENVNHSRSNMMHRKNITHTNTGERYITKRKNRYRITIDKKEYRTCKTLKEAIEKRDKILNGEVVL
jgi:hypothetical protein